MPPAERQSFRSSSRYENNPFPQRRSASPSPDTPLEYPLTRGITPSFLRQPTPIQRVPNPPLFGGLTLKIAGDPRAYEAFMAAREPFPVETSESEEARLAAKLRKELESALVSNEELKKEIEAWKLAASLAGVETPEKAVHVFQYTGNLHQYIAETYGLAGVWEAGRSMVVWEINDKLEDKLEEKQTEIHKLKQDIADLEVKLGFIDWGKTCQDVLDAAHSQIRDERRDHATAESELKLAIQQLVEKISSLAESQVAMQKKITKISQKQIRKSAIAKLKKSITKKNVENVEPADNKPDPKEKASPSL